MNCVKCVMFSGQFDDDGDDDNDEEEDENEEDDEENDDDNDEDGSDMEADVVDSRIIEDDLLHLHDNKDLFVQLEDMFLNSNTGHAAFLPLGWWIADQDLAAANSHAQSG